MCCCFEVAFFAESGVFAATFARQSAPARALNMIATTAVLTDVRAIDAPPATRDTTQRGLWRWSRSAIRVLCPVIPGHLNASAAQAPRTWTRRRDAGKYSATGSENYAENAARR